MKKLVLMLAVAFSMTMFSCSKADNAQDAAAEETEVVEEVVAAPVEEAPAAEGEEAAAAEGEQAPAAEEAPATEAPAAE